jgi:hypothetical protein
MEVEKTKKKLLMRLLPDDDCLEQHIKHANFLAYIQRHHDLRRHPSWFGISEWLLQTSAPHKTCPSNFTSSPVNATGWL